MKVFIVGGSEAGRGIAKSFSLTTENEITLIDKNQEIVDQINKDLDILAICGDAIDTNLMLQQKIKEFDYFIALSESDNTNILSCSISKKLNPNIKTICRCSSDKIFDNEYLNSKDLGIDLLIVPQIECAKKISMILKEMHIKELIFINQKAQIVNFKVKEQSPIAGAILEKFPRGDLIQNVRICTIWRDGNLIVPSGKSNILIGDEIYVSGEEDEIKKLISWACPVDDKSKHIIILGSGIIAEKLIILLKDFFYISVIDPDQKRCHTIAENYDVEVICNDPTSKQTFEEIDIKGNSVFISTLKDNANNNILSCLLAKKSGINKIFTIINKNDYRDIVASMKEIDGCFNPFVAMTNSILNFIEKDECKTGALFHRIPAEIYKIILYKKSNVINKGIPNLKLPKDIVLALIIRDGMTVIPNKDEIFLENDILIIISFPNSFRKIDSLFNSKNIFSNLIN